jgi:hypothetical protein
MTSYQKSNPFPRGSEWRKWDLHVHAPGGRLADGYGDTDEVWEQFCEILADSDVEVFGITDYFSLDTFFECRRRFEELRPDSRKVFFPNIELRLPESVNKDAETVELHILLRPDLDEKRGRTLLAHLTTECKEKGRNRQLPCSELETKGQFESATVTRQHVIDALEKTFGEQGQDPQDYMLIVPANHGGLRSDLGEKRKSEIADRIDELAHGVFGNEDNVEHFLNTGRAKGDITLPPKPVFAGSDAHSITDLKAWLGREVRDATYKSVTWIKADPNFEGLLQTKAEPQNRVRLQANKPDEKDPYKYLRSVRFTGTKDFPQEVVLNSNLVAVIGSRSSGKSSLLAYMAHAIDPDYTEQRQLEVEPRPTESEIGPAPGKTWSSVSEIEVSVEWGEPNTREGRVIYVPQNALYAISQRPEEITVKIRPALERMDPEFEVALRQMSGALKSANEEIGLGVEDWFRICAAIEEASEQLRDRGDKEAIEETRKELGEQIAEKRQASALSEAEAKRYEALMDKLSAIDARLAVLEAETRELSAHLRRSKRGKLRVEPEPKVEVRAVPAPSELPEALRKAVAEIVAEAEASTVTKIAGALVEYQEELDREAGELGEQARDLRKKNAQLIKRNEANSEIEELTKSKRRQDEALKQIEADVKRLASLGNDKAAVVKTIEAAVKQREAAVSSLVEAFEAKPRERDLMVFGIEAQIDPRRREALGEHFNRSANGPFLKAGKPLEIDRCLAEVGAFLEAVHSGKQKLRRGGEAPAVAGEVLVTTPEVRFFAQIEGDRIGGFKTSSMTPGKQALFALSLILDDKEEGWPLLIDQPEDDLDSRSISALLVDYLSKRKRERQIIMVSHDANLVIGADAEQVIVANRHGADRKNAKARPFDYFSGSLEHTRERRDVEVELEKGGIREHACDILDGGEEAFRKRKEKYKIT